MTAPKRTARFMEITPVMARRWLDASETKNRTTSEQSVAEYAARILGTGWDVNGEAIVFDEDGNLLNGHHRLLAVIKADKSIVSLVVRGVSATVFRSYDTGLRRTAGHVLSIEGVPNSNAVAASARFLMQVERGAMNMHKGHKISNMEISEYVSDHPRLIDTAAWARSFRGDKSLHPLTASGIAFLAYSHGDTPDVREFFESVSLRVGLVPGTPELAASRYLAAVSRSGAGKGTHPTIILATVAQAVLASVSGESVKRLREWNPITPFPIAPAGVQA